MKESSKVVFELDKLNNKILDEIAKIYNCPIEKPEMVDVNRYEIIGNPFDLKGFDNLVLHFYDIYNESRKIYYDEVRKWVEKKIFVVHQKMNCPSYPMDCQMNGS